MLSLDDCLATSKAIISLLQSSLIADDTKEEILQTILYKDINYLPESWFLSGPVFALSTLKFNCEAAFRTAVELGLEGALICFKLFNIPYIPDSPWCDHHQNVRYSLSTVQWLYNSGYFNKSRLSPYPERALLYISQSADYYKDEELLKFIKDKDLYTPS